MSKSALGRGLGALLGGMAPAGSVVAPKAAPPAAPPPPVPVQDQVQRAPIGRLRPSSLQPRQDFPPETLKELADSIREQGILQPLIVRPRGPEFELIAGERRWRAAQSLGLTEVPILVREVDDHSALEMMLIENLQRENLNPIEEARGYQQLLTQFEFRQEDVATRVGKSRATVANALRLLKLAPEIQEWLRQGQLTTGHAKAILGLDRGEDQLRLAKKVLAEGASVRATEEWVAQQTAPRPSAAGADHAGAPSVVRDAHVADLENRLQQRLGTKVQLRYRRGKGAVTIHFYNDDDLGRILELLAVKVD